MIQKLFAERAVEILKKDPSVIGLTVGGSWLSGELDEYADLDLILVTKTRISGEKDLMMRYAQGLGNLLSGFTGDHVGEPRLLVCLYDNPLLHVDIKFLTLKEFEIRVEDPVILLDTDDQLKLVITKTKAVFPYPSYQWIEDRFWIWIHYTLGKIARGELFEAIDAIGFIRANVIAQLLHIKNNELPRAMRKVEFKFQTDQLNGLTATIPVYDQQSLLLSMHQLVDLYKQLRKDLFDEKIQIQSNTEIAVIKYLNEIDSLITP
jgi:hypothetical protein